MNGHVLDIPDIWEIYINKELGISFNYPYFWAKASSEHFVGIDGFFHIIPIYSEKSIEEICGLEAFHKLLPYGTEPKITSVEVCNRKAFYIFPSEDQPIEMKRQSALILKHSEEHSNPDNNYKYFILRADKEHVEKIAESISLIKNEF
ncbi:MAG: hypothetical protein ACOZCL_09055 [Bacillota bacterium]